MTRTQLFQDMLHAMAVHFTVNEITEIVAIYERPDEVGYLLFMNNGEYWFVRNGAQDTIIFNVIPVMEFPWLLFKYPPPIPTFEQLPISRRVWQMKPRDLNAWIKNHGGGIDSYLIEKEEG
jgi:hypothetical protein